jgi:hypothetical protein
MIKLAASERTNTAVIFRATAETEAKACERINSLQQWARVNGKELCVTIEYATGVVTSCIVR